MYPTMSAYQDAQHGNGYGTPSMESASAVASHQRRSRTSTYSATARYGALLEDFSGLSLQSRKEPDPSAAQGSPGSSYWERATGYEASEGNRMAHHGTVQPTSHAFDTHQHVNDAWRAQAGAHTGHTGNMLPRPPGLDVPVAGYHSVSGVGPGPVHAQSAGPAQPATAPHTSHTRAEQHRAQAAPHSIDSLGLRSDPAMEGSPYGHPGGYAQSQSGQPQWSQQQYQPRSAANYPSSMPAAAAVNPSLRPYQYQYQLPMPPAGSAGFQADALPTTTSSHRYQSGYGHGSGSGSGLVGGHRMGEEQGAPTGPDAGVHGGSFVPPQHSSHQLYSKEGPDARMSSAYAGHASGGAGQGYSSFAPAPSGLHSYGEVGADRYPHHAVSTSRLQQVQPHAAYAPAVQSTAANPAYPPPYPQPTAETSSGADPHPWSRPGPSGEAGQAWQDAVGQVGGYGRQGGHSGGPVQEGYAERYHASAHSPSHSHQPHGYPHHQHQHAQLAQAQAGVYGAGPYPTRGGHGMQASHPYPPADSGSVGQHPSPYGGGTYGGGPAQASQPEGLLPSADVRQLFAESQWQLLRILLVRRYASVSGNPSHASLTRDNIRAAAALFGLHLTVHSIVSKPHKYSLGDLMAGSGAAAGGGVGVGAAAGWRRGVGGRSAWMDQGVPELPEVDLSLPSRIIITAQDLQRLPTADLPETALGWWDHKSAHASPSASTSSSTSFPHGARAATDHTAVSYTGPISPPLCDTDDAASKVSGAASSVGGVKRDTVPEPVQYVCAAAVGLLAAELVSQRRFKTKLCHAWMKNGGFCPRGDRCDYAHGAEEVRGAAGASSGSARGDAGGVGVMSWGGTSGPGTDATTATSTAEPVKYKQRLCRAWLDTNGSYCPHAARCTFAHGVHELRLCLPRSGVSPAPTQSALSPHADHTGVDHDSVFSDEEDAVSGGPSGREADAAVSGSKTGVVDESGRPLRTKLQLCIAWLTGAAGAAAVYAASAIDDGPQSAGTVLQAVHAAGVARCPSGPACQYAHGIDDLRLPPLAKLHKSVKDTMQASGPGGRPAAATSEQGLSRTSGSVTRDPASGRIVRAPRVHAHSRALSGADQTLLFVASGIALASLPASMVDTLRFLVRSPASARAGPVSAGDSSASTDSPLMIRVDGRFTDPALALSAAGQASVAVATASPITALLLPTLSLHGGPGGAERAAFAPGGRVGQRAGSESTGPAQPLSRTIAMLGVAACTCALLMASVQLRLVDWEGTAAATFTELDTVQHLVALYTATRARLTQSPSEPPLHAVLSSDMLPAGGGGSLGLGPGQPPPSRMGLEHGAGGASRGAAGGGNAGRYGSFQLWKRGRKQQY